MNHPYSSHPQADVIEALGRALYEAADRVYPGDYPDPWEKLSAAEQGAYMRIITEVIMRSPDHVRQMLNHDASDEPT
jgi:hypothetical protein